MNRQVPNKKYTIIGDGKVARHFGHYFNLIGISFNQWQRKQSTKQLHQAVVSSDVVLVLITDDAIKKFINRHSFLINHTLVHFSGTLHIDGVFACHPLMTFAQELYDLETYLSIPFACDEGVAFKNLFPKLQNKAFNIPADQKAYYHAMCVMAGNFSQILMRETSTQLSKNLNLPTDVLFPYLLQNTKNFIANPDNSATGPLQRGDFTTVQKHLQALNGNDLEGIYKSFLQFSNINTPSFLRRQKPHAEYHDFKNNSDNLGDSRLRGNDDGLLENDDGLLGNDNSFIKEIVNEY